MNNKLWEASKRVKQESNLHRYERFLFKQYQYKPSIKYNNLLKWSIKNPKKFWSSIWDFSKVIGKKNLKFYLSKNLIKNKYLTNSKLNFAENLLLKNNSSKAITFISETGFRKVISWKQLNANTSKIISLRKPFGIKHVPLTI